MCALKIFTTHKTIATLNIVPSVLGGGTKIANMQEQSQTCLNYAEQKQFGRRQPKAKGVSPIPYYLFLVPCSLFNVRTVLEFETHTPTTIGKIMSEDSECTYFARILYMSTNTSAVIIITYAHNTQSLRGISW